MSTGFGAALWRPMERLYSRQPHRKWPRGLLSIQHGGSNQEGRWPPTSQLCVCGCVWLWLYVCVSVCVGGRMCVLSHVCEFSFCSCSVAIADHLASCSLIGLFGRSISLSQPVNHLHESNTVSHWLLTLIPSSEFLPLLSPSLIDKPACSCLWCFFCSYCLFFV